VAISYVGTGTPANSSNATLTPALPTGLAEDDLLVCLWSIRSNGSGINTPAGWTAPVYYRNTAATTGPSIAVLTRTYTAGVTAPTLSLTAAVSSATVIAAVSAYRGADPTVTAGAVYSSGTGTTQNIGAIAGVPVPAGGVVIVAGAKADDWTSVATLSGDGLSWGECFDVPSTAGNDGGMVVDYALAPTAVTTAAKTFTVTGGTAVTAVGVQLALGPAAPPVLTVTLTGDTPDTATDAVPGVFLAVSAVTDAAPSVSGTDANAGAVTAVAVAGPPAGAFFRYDADHPAANYATTTTTGGLVDQSGAGQPNAFPTATAPRPTLNTGGAGGHQYLTFDGADDRLTSNGTMLAFGNAKPGLTTAAVVRVNPTAVATGGTSRILLQITIAGSNSGRFTFFVDTTGVWAMTTRRIDTDAAATFLTTTPADDQVHQAVAVVDYTTATQRIYLDGVLIGSRSGGTAGAASSATNSNAWSWGSTATPTQWFPGDFYELIGYDRALTADEITQLWDYGRASYGLTTAAPPVAVNVTGAAPGSGSNATAGAVSATAVNAVTAVGAAATTNAVAPAGMVTAAQRGNVTGLAAATATAGASGVVAVTAVGFVAATGAPATTNTTAPGGTALAAQRAAITGGVSGTGTNATAGAIATGQSTTLAAATAAGTTAAVPGNVVAQAGAGNITSSGTAVATTTAAVPGAVTATATTTTTGAPATSATTTPPGAAGTVRNARNTGTAATTGTATPPGAATTTAGAGATTVTGTPAPTLTSSPTGTVTARRVTTITSPTMATATAVPKGTVTAQQAATTTGVLAATTTTALAGQATAAATAALLAMAADTTTDTPAGMVRVTAAAARDLEVTVTGPRGSPITVAGPHARQLTITGPWGTNAPRP
jgi:hypothetical protein